MVTSKINTSIHYPEIKQVDGDDLKKKSFIYEMEIKEQDVFIVIGGLKNTYENQNVIFFPIYLVKPNDKVIQIGIFEIVASSLTDYLLDDMELNEDKIPEPLLYDFVTKDFIEKTAKKVGEGEGGEGEDEGGEGEGEGGEGEGGEGEGEVEIIPVPIKQKKIYEISANRTDIFTSNKNTQIPDELKIETAQMAKEIREKYHEKEEMTWINKWLKNKYYSIKDNEGGGDCLFATIRDAFDQIGQETSVSQIRKKLSEEVTNDVYNNYKEQFDMYSEAINNTTRESIQLKSQMEQLKNNLKKTIDREQQKIIVKEGNIIKQKYERLKKENELSKELMAEFKIMKNIKSLDDFKKKIGSCDFWADDWAINTLERILNIKIVILSSERFLDGDFESVLQCANIVDPLIEEKKVFEPDFYIIVEHTGSHYKLIGYKNKFIFTFKELPHDLRKIIVDKCLQKEAGIYLYIPEFVSFKQMQMGGSGSMLEDEMEYLNESKLNNLYKENVELGIGSKASGKLIPGKGRHEKMEPSILVLEYVDLYRYPDWRKKLSNEHECEFKLDDHTWNSVEHYYQANKYKKNNPELYYQFCRDSNSEICKNAEMAKAMGSKEGKYKGKRIRDENIIMDEDFYGKREKKVRKDALREKFTQNEELKKILLETKNAKLLSLKKGNPPELNDELMLIRNELNLN